MNTKGNISRGEVKITHKTHMWLGPSGLSIRPHVLYYIILEESGKTGSFPTCIFPSVFHYPSFFTPSCHAMPYLLAFKVLFLFSGRSET